jgi:hypothetical protein
MILILEVCVTLFLIPNSLSIGLIDQPRLFSNLTEWNQNLFKRVSDCIRDTSTRTSTETLLQLKMKGWAGPCCNRILSSLNQVGFPAPVSFNNLRFILDQEICWKKIAYRIYGIRTQTQACGIQSAIVADCAFVTP